MFRRFLRAESGAITVLAIFTTVMVFVLVGISIDVANAYKARTELQVAADTAAHAALYSRGTASETDAAQKAVDLAAANLGLDPANAVVTAADVQFGHWDEAAGSFTAVSGARTAVRVVAARIEDRQNPVATFLLGFVGLNAWDVAAHAVAETYRPICLREGFVAEGILDIQSNNAFTNGFCLHSNEYISVNQNNFFESGTIVSMPDSTLIDGPNSMYDKNDGLAEALTDGFYDIRILSRVESIIADMNSADLDRLPTYIDYPIAATVSGSTLSMTQLEPGRVYRLACDKGKKVTLQNDAVFTEVVLIADCELAFAQGAAFEDVVIANTYTGDKSINAPSGLRLGRDDTCATDGGAQIVTMGGVDVASSLQMYGGQIIAKGNVQFAANANGLEGASIISGGVISGTSNMTMGFCGAGMEDNFEVDYYRIVM